MTPTDLYIAVLEHIEYIPGGQQPQPHDAKKVQDSYNSMVELLSDEDLIDWSVDDDVPAWAENIMLQMLAAIVARAFGVPEPRYTNLQLEGAWDLPRPSLAERALRKHQASKYISSPATPDYF